MEEKGTILIVDDQPDNLQVVGSVLRESNQYKLSMAQSGEKALELVEKSPPDLILLDVMMPGLSGHQVCEYLKSKYELREIPIIFLTAKNDTADIVKGFDLGGVDYVTKPFTPEVLLARVSTNLKLYKQHQAVKRLNKLEEDMRCHERLTAYQNGAIEMSLDVLHNIGNGMVSITNRSESLMDIKTVIKKLGDISAEIDQNLKGNNLDKAQELVLQIKEFLQGEYSENIVAGLRNLINDVEGINEIISDQANLNNEGLVSTEFPIGSVINDVHMLYKNNFVKAGIKFEIHDCADVSIVSLPRMPLTRMLDAIIKNSYEAVIEGMSVGANVGRVEIKLYEDSNSEDYFIMSVHDNGIGVDKEKLQWIFAPRTTTKSGHVGLGLHNAANFVLSLGGSIDVLNSESSSGTIIKMRFPRTFAGTERLN